MSELISVVVLNYNGKEYLKKCLDSLLCQSYSPMEIIMVDNGSIDGSVDFVKNNYPEVKVLVSPNNMGYAGGNNYGVLQAKATKVALLNNDTVVDKGWMKELYEKMKHTGSAVVGSKIYTDGIEWEYHRKNGTLNLIGWNIYNVFNDPEEVFIASGCSLLFDKGKIDVPFDPDYFIYSEDVYLSWLSRLKGYGVCQADNSVVHHIGMATTDKARSRLRTFYQERNRILNILIFYEVNTLLKILPYIMLDFIVRPVYLTFNKRKSLLGWLMAAGWFFRNIQKVIEKRKSVQNQRMCKDNEILKYISCKMLNGESIVCKILNRISLAYCKIAKIRTVEMMPNLKLNGNGYDEVLSGSIKYHHIITKSHFKRETTHGQIIELVKENSVVLDVGCSTGFLGKYLIEKKNCTVYGIEIDQESANKAKQFYKGIYIMDVESEDLLMQINEKFDAIIFGDVLEHLRAPEKVLEKIKQILKPDGSIIISVPNIANWRIRWELLMGKFEYQDSGILDKNHLRFFTLKSICNLFDKSGYKIVYFRGAGAKMPVFLRNIYPSILSSQFVFKIKLK